MHQPIKAVIFDFNGTLFRDTDFHNKAWLDFADLNHVHITAEDFDKNIHGHTNKEILYYLFGENLTTEELYNFYEEKEEIYRSICKKNPELCILAPGAENFLNYLKENNIKRTIATASYPKNIAFYNELFKLEKWFIIDQIIHDNGTYRGKPDPGMFLAAANLLQLSAKECMIIEDSIMGITAAKNAQAGKIIAISDIKKDSRFSNFKFIDQIITHFNQIDLSCFN